jgi:hypothetical protein
MGKGIMQAGSTIGTQVSTRTSRLPNLPLALLGIAILACALLLTVPLTLPLGPMYWDLVLYLDAANRIGDGQVPLIDFIAPVGPLGYWLFAGLDALFPRAQPLLTAQWCLFAVTAPAMALVLHQVGKLSRAKAMALLLPYLAFQVLPINVEHYSFFPGTDGFGIYNRHVSIVLYVLVSGLVFLRGLALGAIIGWTLPALFLIKITGFLAGGLVTAFALAAGRIGWRQSLLIAGAAGIALIGFEIATGLVSAYLDSILALIAINAGGILPRFIQAASLHLDIVGAGAALGLALLWLERREIIEAALAFRRTLSAAGFIRLLDRDVAWLGVVLAAGLFFETQNTGGQAFVFVWPVLLVILSRWLGSGRPGALLVCGLVAATAIPPAETVLQRGARALMAQAGYTALPNQHLGRLGQVSQHAGVMTRAAAMLDIYAAHPATFQDFAAREMLPAPQLYSELDFQASLADGGRRGRGGDPGAGAGERAPLRNDHEPELRQPVPLRDGAQRAARHRHRRRPVPRRAEAQRRGDRARPRGRPRALPTLPGHSRQRGAPHDLRAGPDGSAGDRARTLLERLCEGGLEFLSYRIFFTRTGAHFA